MPTSTQRSKYEAALARAFRALYQAANAAEEMGEEGTSYDCRGLMIEVQRMTEASLRGKGKRRMEQTLQLKL